MDISKIKERLAALSPEDLASGDPEIEELLMLVEEDLELAEWFAQEQVFDQAFAKKLQEIQPPAGLDDRIVAAMEEAKAASEAPAPVPAPEPEIDPDATEIITPFEPAAEATPAPEAEKPAAKEEEEQGSAVPFSPTPQRHWWQNSSIMSAAAAAILILAVVMVLFDGQKLSAEDLGHFYQTIGKHHQSGAPLSLETDDLDTIRTYLSEQGAPVPGTLPGNIDPYPEIGCSVMKWGSEVVSVIRMDDNEMIDVYVVRQGLFPDIAHGPQPKLVDLGQLVVLGWSDDTAIYFLVRTGDLKEIDSLL